MKTPVVAHPVEAATHEDPYPYYAQLVADRPVYRDAALNCWVVSSAAAVSEVLANPCCTVRPAGEPVPANVLGSTAGRLFGHLVRMNDGASHRMLKQTVARTLDTLPQAQLEAAAQAAAAQVHAAATPDRPGPGLTDYCYQTPAQAMGHLLGLPPAQRASAAQLTSLLVRCISPGGTPEQVLAGREAADQLWRLFEGLLADGPGDGLLGALQREAGKAGIGPEAVVANAIGFMTQSFEASAGLVGNALLALARDAGLMRQVCDEPMCLPAVVREALRFDSPIQNTRRFAASNFTVQGTAIRQGEALLLVLAAANRDPAVNPEPHRFHPSRPAAALFSFGDAAHRCPGQRIAETVATAALAQLLERGFDPGRLRQPVTYRHSQNARVPELQCE